MKTNLIDFTLSPEISLFFATHKIDNGKYVPLCEEDIGRNPTAAILVSKCSLNQLASSEVGAIIASPAILPRTMDQMGFLISDEAVSQMSCRKFRFELTEDGCRAISHMFDGGRKLWNHCQSDKMEELIKEIDDCKIIDKWTLFCFANRLECWDNADVMETAKKMGYAVVDSFDNIIDEFVSHFDAIFENVKVSAPESYLDFIMRIRNGEKLTTKDVYGLVSNIMINREWNELCLKQL